MSHDIAKRRKREKCIHSDLQKLLSACEKELCLLDMVIIHQHQEVILFADRPAVSYELHAYINSGRSAYIMGKPGDIFGCFVFITSSRSFKAKFDYAIWSLQTGLQRAGIWPII